MTNQKTPIKAQHRAWRFRVLQGIAFILLTAAMSGVSYAYSIDILSYWAWLALLILYFAALATMYFGIESLRKRYLEKTEHGIWALKEFGAKWGGAPNTVTFDLPDRKVVVDVIGGSTRIRVEHRGDIPCVIRIFPSEEVSMDFFTKDVYMEWRREHKQAEIWVPGEVKLHGRKVPTALPMLMVPTARKWAKRILDAPNIKALGGTIMIEPHQVMWVRGESMLHKEFLLNAVHTLARVAEKIEQVEVEWGPESRKVVDPAPILSGYSLKMPYKNVFFAPDIPEKKLANALKRYAPIQHGEQPLVLVDDTWFADAKNGMLLTDQRIYARQSLKKPRSLPLEEIRDVSCEGEMLHINGKAFWYPAYRRQKFAQDLCQLLRDIYGV